MKTIYLDSNYMCHINNNGTRQKIVTDVFDSMCEKAIECYRFIPEGQVWKKTKAITLRGPFIQAVAESNLIQQQHEIDDSKYTQELGALIDEIYAEDLDIIG